MSVLMVYLSRADTSLPWIHASSDSPGIAPKAADSVVTVRGGTEPNDQSPSASHATQALVGWQARRGFGGDLDALAASSGVSIRSNERPLSLVPATNTTNDMRNAQATSQIQSRATRPDVKKLTQWVPILQPFTVESAALSVAKIIKRDTGLETQIANPSFRKYEVALGIEGFSSPEAARVALQIRFPWLAVR
ncbi:MAG: hypothetical protein AAGI88_19285 [Pseudomonadota bacterium]